jgi:hypothetical protein
LWVFETMIQEKLMKPKKGKRKVNRINENKYVVTYGRMQKKNRKIE